MADRQRLANNWFLVSDAPERAGFVSWEISDADSFGQGRRHAGQAVFVGFITDDPLVVTELVSSLGTWGRPPQLHPPSRGRPTPIRPDAASQALIDAIAQTTVDATGAASGAVIRTPAQGRQ